MTAQEKASELIEAFYKDVHRLDVARECAWSCVNEILKIDVLYDSHREQVPREANTEDTKQFWESVKTEIEKL